jgi:hypothetical protein
MGWSLTLLTACASALRPLNPINVTMWHVGLANTTGLTNMDSGDALGDADFMLRAAGLQYLCSDASGERNYTYDCDDAEQTGDDLVVSQFIVEMSNEWSEYAECNVANGTYSCICENRTGTGHHHSRVPCTNPVGKIRVVNESGFASRLPDPSDPYERTAYRYYFYNAAQKLGGLWYSTLEEGNCDRPGISQANCTWRIAETSKRVSKTCQESHVFDVVEERGAACFQQCGPARNLSTACWTNCFYDTVFGPKSNATAYPVGSNVGMDAQEIVDAWLAPFRSSDAAKGGCPAV